jgi:hypothetical protein
MNRDQVTNPVAALLDLLLRAASTKGTSEACWIETNARRATSSGSLALLQTLRLQTGGPVR